MKNLIDNQRWFLIPFIIWIVFGGAYIFTYDKFELFVALKRYNSTWADVLFTKSSQLAEIYGWFLVVMFVAFFKNFRYAFISLLCLLISGLSTQILKKLVFKDFFRPKYFLEQFPDIYLVEGVKLNTLHAFPSGHTTSAFTIVFLMSIIFANRSKGGVFLFLIGLVIGFSRIYLVQHFPQDVWAGSIVGVIMTTLVFFYSDKYLFKNEPEWMQNNLSKLLKARRE